MNCVLLSKTTGLELDSYDVHSADLPNTTIEANYATAPMAAVVPADRIYDEEELHTSFEQAISGRVSALQGRLNRLSAPQPVVGRRYGHTVTTEPWGANSTGASFQLSSLFGGFRQRYTVWIALALNLVMLGFDLMGLLVLNMH